MKPEEFCYWLQGFFEMSNPKTLDEKQTAALKAHLALVFEHAIDPSYVSHLPPAEAEDRRENLQSIHDGKPPKRPPHVRFDVRDLDPHRRYKC